MVHLGMIPNNACKNSQTIIILSQLKIASFGLKNRLNQNCVIVSFSSGYCF